MTLLRLTSRPYPNRESVCPVQLSLSAVSPQPSVQINRIVISLSSLFHDTISLCVRTFALPV